MPEQTWNRKGSQNVKKYKDKVLKAVIYNYSKY